MQNYGQIIKEIRQEKGYTLKEFSEKTGLSIGFLSKIERGVNNPSFTNLQKITYALGVSSSIFENAEVLSNQPEEKLYFRKEDRSLIYSYDSGIKMEGLLSHKDIFHVSVMTLSGDKNPKTSARHKKNEFGIILKGSLCISIDGNDYLLRPEDAILVPAEREHTTQRVGNQDCVSIWIQFD